MIPSIHTQHHVLCNYHTRPVYDCSQCRGLWQSAPYEHQGQEKLQMLSTNLYSIVMRVSEEHGTPSVITMGREDYFRILKESGTPTVMGVPDAYLHTVVGDIRIRMSTDTIPQGHVFCEWPDGSIVGPYSLENTPAFEACDPLAEAHHVQKDIEGRWWALDAQGVRLMELLEEDALRIQHEWLQP